MELELGDFEGLVDTGSSSNTGVISEEELVKPKACEAQWFLQNTGSFADDEDEIKFQADFYFYRKKFSTAIDLYLKLMTCQKYGSSRSLLAEVYESLAICYRKLGNSGQALFFSAKSDAIGKSADHRSSTLYIKTRTMLSSASEKEAVMSELKKLLLLHPYNHFIWSDFAFLHADTLPLALYLVRVSILLRTNSRNVTSFIAEKQEEMEQQVEKTLSNLSQELGERTVASLRKLVKDQDRMDRLTEEWLNEDYRIRILNSPAQEIADLFHQKWTILLDEVK